MMSVKFICVCYNSSKRIAWAALVAIQPHDTPPVHFSWKNRLQAQSSRFTDSRGTLSRPYRRYCSPLCLAAIGYLMSRGGTSINGNEYVLAAQLHARWRQCGVPGATSINTSSARDNHAYMSICYVQLDCGGVTTETIWLVDHYRLLKRVC